MPRSGPALLSYSNVAQLLDCSVATVKRLWKKGSLAEPQMYEGIGMRFWAEDVYEYIYAEKRAKRKSPKRN